MTPKNVSYLNARPGRLRPLTSIPPEEQLLLLLDVVGDIHGEPSAAAIITGHAKRGIRVDYWYAAACVILNSLTGFGGSGVG